MKILETEMLCGFDCQSKIPLSNDFLVIFAIFPLKLDMRTKMMEAKFYEEKLKLQQKHDADVQKVGYIHLRCMQYLLCSGACDGPCIRLSIYRLGD